MFIFTVKHELSETEEAFFTMKFENEILDEMRLKKDPLADGVVDFYSKTKTHELESILATMQNNDCNLCEAAAPALHDLYIHIKTTHAIPDEEIALGQKFFSDNASDILTILGVLSVPYCYAATNGVEAISQSKSLLDSTEKMLAIIAQFVQDVMSEEAFLPQGKGFLAILRLRLFYASIRHSAKKSGWNEEEKGAPINQEDMVIANLAFSLMVVRGLRRMGKMIYPNESGAYFHYWNMIGAKLGVEECLLPLDNKAIFNLEKQVRKRQFNTSSTGQKFAESLLSYYRSAATNTPVEGKVKAFLSYMLGDNISEMLGVLPDENEQVLFKAYPFFLKFKNMVLRTEDCYAQTFGAYVE